jgi:pimeloyl-ACP methyl ester carboxylesterase
LLSKQFGFYPYLSDVLAGSSSVWSVDPGLSGYHPGIPDFDECVAKKYTLSSELADLEHLVAAMLEQRVSGAPMWNRREIVLIGHGKGAALALHLERRLRSAGSGLSCALALLSPPATIVREGWVAGKAGRSRVRVPCDRGDVELETGFLDDARELEASASLEELMATTSAPALVVCGEQDPVFTVREAERLVSAGDPSKDQLVVIEQAGHHFGATHPFDRVPGPVKAVAEVVRRFVAAWVAKRQP